MLVTDLATRPRETTDRRQIFAIVFGSTFAGQAALVSLSPMLPSLAADLQIATAEAGQLRALTGTVATAVAVLLVIAVRADLRRTVLGGLALLAAGAGASALAPSFLALSLTQGVLAVGVALTLTGALAASAAWVPARRRSRGLAVALAGQPAAWILGIPAVGVLTAYSWRLGWLVPFAAALLTLLAATTWAPRRQPDLPGQVAAAGARRKVLRWAVGEALEFGGWTGALVYAGALFIAAGASVWTTGLLLAAGALAYLAGSVTGRRWVDRFAQPMAAGLGLAMAVAALLLCVVRPTLAFSVVAFAALSALGGARTIAGSALGVSLAGTALLSTMGLRTAAVQCGYLLGAGLGGAGLALSGWPGLGLTLAALLVAGAAVHRR